MMNKIIGLFLGLMMGFVACAYATPPKQLITHNNTNFDSNAYIAGTIPSQYPTPAQGMSKVPWTNVRLACFGHVVNGLCTADIVMGINTPNPINIGTVSVDINTGAITPAQISSNGFTLTVVGLGETVITQD